ncbi:MAG: murein biosynthesis integral membrane protein MurJ [bacterium]|nr:murein biosynthesis integral membrane protein MurJ [bacterium]
MKKHSLLRGAINFSVGTGISRILGLLREIVFAHFFGAGIAMDAFRVAFRIPNLLRDVLAEGTLTPAFVPMFADYHANKDKKATTEFVSLILGTMLLITGAITLISIIFAPWLVKLVAYGFQGEKFLLTVKLTRILFPFLIFITVSALVMGVLNFFNHFFTTGIASCWFDVAIIGLGVALAPQFGITSIAIGALIGGALQLVSQFPQLRKEGYLVRPKFKFTPEVKKVLLLMMPIAIGYSAMKINTIINTLIASFLQDGVIAWLEYAFRIMWVPVGVLGVALANVALPSAAKNLSGEHRKEFTKTMRTAFKYGVLCSIASTVLIWVLAHPVCKLLYQHGKFTPTDTINTALALQAYAIGIPGLILARILATGFYALKETKTPMIASFVTVGVNVIFALILVKIIGFTGIPWASSISNSVNALWLGVLLLKRLNVK